MIWHPDKNPASNNLRPRKVQADLRAYEVLGDPRKHLIYDVEAIKSVQFPPPRPSSSVRRAAASRCHQNTTISSSIRILSSYVFLVKKVSGCAYTLPVVMRFSLS
ncbi:hypothetical protein FEM48_Zijuj05G0149500 [Ziziphus jujuba var. spinosa]|uniref:J domain-containing protein n=1 Tax=Ziziphus jujuba var. spinosa TaxID=714518 RepID=A0A978VFH0_ZIZJJ|nr:hypothetical protein FEM48_Zijuj05G0149500 [Ziziphus jujuba var. spinosa]